MSDFPKISYSDGGVHVTVDLRALDQRMKEAQQWLGDRVLEDCKACMPLLTGDLQQRSHTEDDGKRVVFPGPYARYLYGGVVMVDSVTGKGPRKIPTGPGEYILRFRKGAKLVATDRPLTYSNPRAVPKWFEAAKQQHKQFWIDGVKEKIGGK